MGMTVKVKRRTIDLSGLVPALVAEQERHAREVVDLYEATVDGWTNPPDFTIKRLDLVGLSVNIYARGNEAVVKQYGWIDGGFQRKVAMTDDFIAKSTPGVLTQGAGRGGVKRDKYKQVVLLPFPVQTEPRRFTPLIAKTMHRAYFDGMRKVLQRHLRNRG
jgi:hypothetical protein